MNGTATIKKFTAFASSWSAALKKIATPLWRVLTFSLADESIYPDKTLAASLEKGTLSAAYGTRLLSQIKIQGFKEYSFEEDRYPQPDVFASSLALAINDLGAARASVSLSIPKEWAIINTTEFPITVKENLSDVISYELDRITPFSSQDAFYDFKVLGENAGKITVLVVAAKAEFVRPYIDELKEKGITVSRVTVNLAGFETLCRYIDGKADQIFVEMRKDDYEGALFQNGLITGAFSGSFSAEDERSKINALMEEITPLMDTLKNRGKTPQIMMYLKDSNPVLKELLKLQTNQPVRILNETDIKISLPDRGKVISYAAIGGVVDSLWQKANGLNLLGKGSHKMLNPPKGFTVILIILILAMWILYFVAPLRIEEKKLEEIDRQITARKEEVRKVEALKKEIESLNDEVSTINNFKENRPMSLNILKELTTVLPKNTWLSRARITQTNVELEGYAASATGLLPKLEASPLFKKAEFSSPTFRDARMNADRFNMKMEIEGIKKDERKKEEGTDEDEEE